MKNALGGIERPRESRGEEKAAGEEGGGEKFGGVIRGQYLTPFALAQVLFFRGESFPSQLSNELKGDAELRSPRDVS